ncbi:MAG: helix-turn-helix transcriptional regulator, partial [Polyangiaceae bacterium]|nr:helix-turn-helix transcriptional regulator [Polyangiaceae bacterium]
MPRGSGWLGRMFVFSGRLLYVGAIGPTELHSHHAFQIGWALGGDVLRFADKRGSIVDADAVLVPNDAAHAFRGFCPSAVMLFVDPESREGLALRRLRVEAGSAAAWREAAARLSRAQTAPRSIASAASLADAALSSVVEDPGARRGATHPAVRRTLALLATGIEEDLRLEAIAAKVGLSASRLRHVFAEEVGIPLRRYLLWRRLMAAAEVVREGRSLTNAAHHAGFTDSAHLTKAFRRMFGLAPSDAMADIE